jgi:ectoine hydroxylase-related dioxygenase (phytanoyl-CoA dioxygenase family)
MSERPVLTHGVTRRHQQADETDGYVEDLRLVGYTLVPSGLSAAELAGLRSELDAIYERQAAELGGEDALRRCNEIDIARAPLACAESFVDVCTNPTLLRLVARMLGESYVLVQQNGLLTRPAAANYQARWHRDLSYQHWVASEPLAINALLALDDFTHESGATLVLPASHHLPEFPSDACVERHQRALVAPAGTFLVLDAMLFHRAGRNVSGRPRRAVNHLIGRPFMAQQLDYPALLGDRYAQRPALASYLGYRWRPQPDVASWRRQRMAEAVEPAAKP